MGTLIVIVFLAGTFYVTQGIFLSWVEYKKRTDKTAEFKLDWNKIMLWPKDLF